MKRLSLQVTNEWTYFELKFKRKNKITKKIIVFGTKNGFSVNNCLILVFAFCICSEYEMYGKELI